MIKDNKQYRVLVVEDNTGDFTLVVDFLTEKILNPVILHAVNFKEASKIILDSDTPFDIILLDLSLPDKNGKDLIAEMLQLASSCPIIILTGYTDIDFSIRSIAQGIFDYLLKDDLNAEILYKSIVYSIERKKNISELKESEKRYSDLFHLSPQPMWVYDAESFRFVQVNKATIALYGYSEAEFLNMTLMDIKLKENIPAASAAIKNPGPSGQIFKSVMKHVKKSGDIIEVEIYNTSIVINDKDFRSVIAIDVTEKNQFDNKITRAIIKTQEDERYEIGSELHDNVCQILAASQFSLDMLKNAVTTEKMYLLDQCTVHTKMALDEIRNLSHRLAPAFFDDSTLEEAFKTLFGTFNVREQAEILLHFDLSVKKYPLSMEIQLNLYRILQEQLRNILKYAKATLIEVNVVIYNHILTMQITDNGIGFNRNTVKKGIGLANMKRRAELFSGIFEIDSSPGNGCTIIIDIPLNQITNLTSKAG